MPSDAITYDELRTQLGSLPLIDVMPEASFRAAHLPSALSLPLEELGTALEAGDTRIPADVSERIVVYCANLT